jgi:hypothetical protein
VDDARRLYVKKEPSVRTKCELKKAGKTTERRKAPRLSEVGSFRDVRVGRRERLYERSERVREDHRPTRDPLGKPWLPLIRLTFCVNSWREARGGYTSESEKVKKHHQRARDPLRRHAQPFLLLMRIRICWQKKRTDKALKGCRFSG